MVSWQQRWYVVARRHPARRGFRPDPTPGRDYAAFVLRDVASTGWNVHARILVDAGAEQVLSRINPAVGVVETIDDEHSMLVTGADGLEIVAVWIGMLGLDFHVTDPPELVEQLRVLADRYRRALPPSTGSTTDAMADVGGLRCAT